MATPPYPPPPPGFPPDPRARYDARSYARSYAHLQRAQFRAMRHRSLLGPLLMMLTGVVFLLLNLHLLRADRFWALYGRFWPLLLIAIGVLLVVESLLVSHWRHVRTRGGPIWMILLICVLGVIATERSVNWNALRSRIGMEQVYGVPHEYGFDGVALNQLFGHKHQASQQVQFPITPGGTLLIQNPHGDLTVTAGTGSQMFLTLQKTVYADSDSRAQSRLDAIQATALTVGNLTTLRVNTDDGASADLILTVPPTVAIEAHVHYGDVTLAGSALASDPAHGNWQAPVTIDSQHGDVHLSNIAAPVHASLQRGDFSAQSIQGSLSLDGRMTDARLAEIRGPVLLHGDFFGDVHLEKISAPVHFHSSRTQMDFARIDGAVTMDAGDLTADHAVSPASITTRAKDIVMTGVSGDLTVENSDGDIHINALAPLGKMEIQNHRGDIRLTVPASARFSISATATDGDIHSNFNLPTQNGDHHTTITGSVNGGDVLLHLTADKGDIDLHKQ